MQIKTWITNAKYIEKKNKWIPLIRKGKGKLMKSHIYYASMIGIPSSIWNKKLENKKSNIWKWLK